MDAASRLELRKGGANVGDDRARQRDGGNVVEVEQAGAQAVVDVVGVVGDVVGNRRDLRLGARR